MTVGGDKMYHVAFLHTNGAETFQTASSSLDGTGFTGWTVQSNPGGAGTRESATVSIATDGKNLYYAALTHNGSTETFKVTSSTVTSQPLLSKQDGYELILTGGGFVFDWAGSPKSFGTTSTSAFSHVAITLTGSVMTYYVDGALVRTQTVAADFSLTATDLKIGGDSAWFDGILDEVRISSNARSAEWIEASYLSQNGSFAFNTLGQTTDKAAPVISSAVMSDYALKVGETSTLTITFSEAVTAFANADITLANGTLSTISSADSGATWTGTFTPIDDIEDTNNVITVGTTLADLAGNAPLTGPVRVTTRSIR